MLPEKEAKAIRKFVCGQLRDEPNLSTLDLGILKRRYLAQVRCESLSPEAKTIMRLAVEEQLMKMQDTEENESELETSKKPQNKRKRENERDEVISGEEEEEDDDKSTAKKSRRQSNSSSESEEKDDCKPAREEEKENHSESEDSEQEVKKTQRKKKQISSKDSADEEINKSKEKTDCEDNPKEIVLNRTNVTKNGGKRRSNTSRRKKTQQSDEENETDTENKSEKSNKINSSDSSDDSEKEEKRKTNAKGKPNISKDSTDEEMKKSEEEKSDCEDNPKEMVMKGANATKNEGKRSSNTSRRKKTPQSDEENDTDTENKSEKSNKINSNDSSDDSEKEEKLSEEDKNNDMDSDSSLPSLDDEPHGTKEKTQHDKKKKATEKDDKKEKRGKSKKDDDKAVVRLKRYIALCGVRLNYKKLLDGYRSIRSQVAVLKKELEGLGVHGQPSIVKCKKVRLKREESRELADLDVSNIIATEGRPKRRGASAWREQPKPPSSTYLRSLNSGSDSDDESNTHQGRRRATDWANLQGVISDDGDSD